MKNIYIASNSVEADSVVNKLSQNGINASCRQKENFSVMAGNTEVEFEIFVDDWEADKAKKLLSKKDYTPSMDLKKASYGSHTQSCFYSGSFYYSYSNFIVIRKVMYVDLVLL